MDSRRDFIKKAAMLSGALGLPNVIPMSIPVSYTHLDVYKRQELKV